MSRDIPRVHVEAALGLLRQGRDREAKKLLEDALAGRAETSELPEDAPLELAITDPTPEIPTFQVNAAGELTIDDEGWVIDPELIVELGNTPWLQSGAGVVWAAEKTIREKLTQGVKTGKVRRE
jgi:hypothetical protein